MSARGREFVDRECQVLNPTGLGLILASPGKFTMAKR